jgi:hypothetical protein
MPDIMCRATTANEGGNHAPSSVLIVFYPRVVSRCLLPIERRSEEEDAAVQVGPCQCNVLPTLKAYSEARPSPRTTFVFRLRGDALAQLRSVRRYVVFNSTGRSARL